MGGSPSKMKKNPYCVITYFESWRDIINTQNMFVHTYQISGSKRKTCKFQNRVQIFKVIFKSFLESQSWDLVYYAITDEGGPGETI